MASVKASENQSTVLATLPSTLLFDTFKSSRDDEKDSDEESFHLPMLDCDEDLQLDKSNIQAAESEEDILNKFEAGTSEAPADDSNIESANETPEHKNSTNESEDAEKIEDAVVDDKGENVCENDGNSAEVTEENYEDATDDAAVENDTELENEMPMEETEEPSNENSTENSDPVNDKTQVVDNETCTDESPIVDNADNETMTNAIPVGDDQYVDEEIPLEDGEHFNNDAGDSPIEDNEQASFDKITTECDEPLNTETLAESNEQLNDEIATVEDNIDNMENQNGDDKIDTVVSGENEELNETYVDHLLDNNVDIQCNETTNEDTVSEDNVGSPKTVAEKNDKLEEEEQLESLLSQGESTCQTYINGNSNLDDEEASLKDLVDNINVRMDDNDELEMNDDLMSGVSESRMSDGAQDDLTDKVNPLEDTNDAEAAIGVEVQGTEENNEKLSEDSEAIKKVSGDLKEGDNFESNIEAMDTEENNEVVESESERAESHQKVCTMDLEDAEEPMLVDDDEEHEDAEKTVQNGLIEDEASKIEQDADSCEALVEDEFKDTGNIPQTECSEDPLIEEAEIGQETESCKVLGVDEIEDAEKNTQTPLYQDPLAEQAPETEQGTESSEALDQDEIIEDAEGIQDELTQDPLAESLVIGQETENSETLGGDDVVKDAEDVIQTELNKDSTAREAPETGQAPESCEAFGENTEEADQTELSRDPIAENATEVEQETESSKALGEDAEEIHQDRLAEEFSEIDHEMEICKDLDKEAGHNECEEKNSTDVEKTENSSKELKETSKTDTVSEIQETSEAPSAENEPSKKESEAIAEDKKNEPETKEEDSNDNLLDISVIRDVDEDNATAIAEQAADSQSSEKSDNDELDQEDDKTDDVDDSEPDHEADKDESMDFEEEDDTTNVCDSVIEDTCDSDALKIDAVDESRNKEGTDTPISEEDVPLSQRLSAKQSEGSDKQAEIEADVDTTLTPEADKVDVQPDPTPDTPTSSVPDTVTPITKATTKGVASQKKRSSSSAPQNETPSKKIRLSEEKVSQEEAVPKTEEPKETKSSDKIKALLSFENYMQTKKIKDKLSRSDLEQLCIQKICEAIIHKTDVGELHQTVKKQEQLIENLRKDLQTLSKQARDLDIVNKKLMNELKTQNNGKKPIVPLKITRSVGLQVKLSMGAEPTRRKSTSTAAASSTPPKTPSSPLVNRTRNVQTNAAVNSALRTIAPAPSPVRSPATQTTTTSTTTTPILTKALTSSQQATQQRSPLVTHSSPASPMKRGPIRKSPGMSDTPKVQNNSSSLKQAPNKASPMKPSQPGVIDLTDEDDRVAAPKTGGPAKTLRGVPIVSSQTKANGTPAKGAVQPKNVVKVGQQGTTPNRTVAGLPQSVRLTPNQVKNGIAIPVSTGSTTQLMYVVQPTSTANSNQKTLTLLNLPTQQLLTSMNGSTVSMISSKSPGTVQVKQLPARKHPAPLPLPPVMPVNSTFKPVLPKPHLSIRKTDNGIILQWRMPYNLDLYESIASYQLFAYQETNAPPSTEMWRKVGDVKALALPMACTLTQFADKNKYYFAVRSVDVHKRIGAFSDPEEISL